MSCKLPPSTRGEISRASLFLLRSRDASSATRVRSRRPAWRRADLAQSVSARSGRLARQVEHGPQPSGGRLLQPERAAVERREVADDRQAEAGARLGLVETPAALQ